MPVVVAALCGIAFLVLAVLLMLDAPLVIGSLRGGHTSSVEHPQPASEVTPPASAKPATCVGAACGPVEGGLTDPELKSQVWSTIESFYRNMRDCTYVTNSEIKVTQQPAESGGWAEAWTISACGVHTVLRITYSMSPDGGVYYDIAE